MRRVQGTCFNIAEHFKNKIETCTVENVEEAMNLCDHRRCTA